MGFELSVVAVIFFISAIMLGTVSYTMLSTSNEVVLEAYDQHFQMQLNQLHTDVSIDALLADTSSGDQNLIVVLSNTGSETLRFDELSVLINGNLTTYMYDDHSDIWTPAQTRNMTIDGIDTYSDLRIKVITSNGVSAYGSY